MIVATVILCTVIGVLTIVSLVYAGLIIHHVISEEIYLAEKQTATKYKILGEQIQQEVDEIANQRLEAKKRRCRTLRRKAFFCD